MVLLKVRVQRGSAAGCRDGLQDREAALDLCAALEGMGLAILPKWMIRRDLAEGRLEPLLPGTVKLSGWPFVVYPSRKYLSAKFRTFLAFLVQDHRLR